MGRRAKKKIKEYQFFFAHLLAWLLYALYFYFTSLLTRPTIGFIETTIFLIPFIVTFYVSVCFLTIFYKKGLIWLVASFFIIFILMAILGYLYLYLFLPSFQVVLFTSRELKPFLQDAIRGYVRFFSFALLYFYIKKIITDQHLVRRLLHAKALREIENWQLKQQELKAIEEKLQYEYAFLRAQINPHFLHNTLNTFYSEALLFSPALAQNILKLSAIMRYSIDSIDLESGKVFVRKELEYLEILLDIYCLRFQNRQAIQWQVKGVVTDQMVPPLSFITIVENAFKYGDIQPISSPLIIRVVLTQSRVYFYCQNKVSTARTMHTSTQIGLSNLRRRLEAAFKDKYEMNVTCKDENYIFELQVMS